MELATAELEAMLLANIDDDAADAAEATSGAASSGEPASILLDFGGDCRIRYFFLDNRFEATCGNPAHVSAQGTPCRLTRTAIGDGEGLGPNGRPLGSMAEWLMDSFVISTREEHRNPFYIMSLPLEGRQRRREQIKTMVCGEEILAKERKQRPGEPEEPLMVPMGW